METCSPSLRSPNLPTWPGGLTTVWSSVANVWSLPPSSVRTNCFFSALMLLILPAAVASAAVAAPPSRRRASSAPAPVEIVLIPALLPYYRVVPFALHQEGTARVRALTSDRLLG